MGVYIIGEKMPNNCTECFKHNKCDKYHIEIVKNEDGDFLPTYVADNCPLIEIKTPHGRLIDEKDVLRYLNTHDENLVVIEAEGE